MTNDKRVGARSTLPHSPACHWHRQWHHTIARQAATPRTSSATRSSNAFYAAHDGYSIDWLLANPQLQAAFHDACRETGLIGGPADWNRELLRFRKTGEFPKRGQIKKVHVADDELDAYSFAAEIAWRLTSDKFDGPSLDEIFCDPAKAAYFDRAAKRFAPGFEPAQYRWAALRLRKASRELVNEVKQYHFVFAKRDFTRFQPGTDSNRRALPANPASTCSAAPTRKPLFIGRAPTSAAARQARRVPAQSPTKSRTSRSLTGDDLPGDEYQDAFKEDLVRRYAPVEREPGWPRWHALRL